jgi:hypothetical protein
MLTSRHAAYALVAVAIILGLLPLGVGIANAQVLGFLADSIFDRLDTNHDGILSRDEVRAARSTMFDRIDTDRSGTATLAEIEAAKAKAQERRAKRPCAPLRASHRDGDAERAFCRHGQEP